MDFLSDLPDFVQLSRLDATLIFERQQQCIIHPSRAHRKSRENGDKWVHLRTLGSGAQGCVALQAKQTRGSGAIQHRAVKKIRIIQGNIMFNKLVLRELEAIFTFSQAKFSDHFVSSHAWYSSHDSIFIAMDYHQLGDLGKYLQDPNRCPAGRIKESEAQEIALQVLEALALMHQHGFSHRDLKPENILIQEQPPSSWGVKIGDFGISKRGAEVSQISDIRGTTSYIAPELIFSSSAGHPDHPYALDMWALAATIFRLLTGKPMFSLQTLAHYAVGHMGFPEEVLKGVGASDDAIAFLSHLAVVDPQKRPTSDEALDHLWIGQPPAEGFATDPVPSVLRIPGPNSHITLADLHHGTDTVLYEPEHSAAWPDEIVDSSDEPTVIQLYGRGRSRLYSATWSDQSEDSLSEEPTVVRFDGHDRNLHVDSASPPPPAVQQPHRPRDADLARQLEEKGDVFFKDKNFARAESVFSELYALLQETVGHEDESAFRCHYKLANSLFGQGKLEQAAAIYQTVTEFRKKYLGKVHVDTLAARLNLGVTLSRTDDGKAVGQAILREVLALQKKHLSRDHPDILDTMNALALSLKSHESAESREEAGKLFQNVFFGREKAHGEDDEKTVESLDVLTQYLIDTGDYEKLESICRRTLGKKQKSLGSDNMATVKAVEDLARAVVAQDKDREAFPLFAKVASMKARILGKDDFSTLQSKLDLAAASLLLGYVKKADDLYEETIRLAREKDEGNALTWSFMTSFATHLRSVHPEDLDQREKLYRDILCIKEKFIGQTHKETVESRKTLALFLLESRPGKERDGISLLATVLEQMKRVPGAEKANAVDPMVKLADAYAKIGEKEKATESYRSICHLLSENYAENDDSMEIQAYAIGKLYTLGENQEAKSLLRKVHEKRQQIMGPMDPSTLGTLQQLANLHFVDGSSQEAVGILQLLVPRQKQVLGEDHDDTILGMKHLARSLVKLGGDGVGDAETLYRDLLRILIKKNGPEDLGTLSIMEELTGYLSDRGEQEEARNMYRILAHLRKKTQGPNHAATIRCMFGLFVELSGLALHEQAADVLGQIFTSWESTGKGMEARDVTIAENYVQVLESQHRYEKLACVLEHLLRHEQKELGPKHDKTLATLARLENARAIVANRLPRP